MTSSLSLFPQSHLLSTAHASQLHHPSIVHPPIHQNGIAVYCLSQSLLLYPNNFTWKYLFQWVQSAWSTVNTGTLLRLILDILLLPRIKVIMWLDSKSTDRTHMSSRTATLLAFLAGPLCLQPEPCSLQPKQMAAAVAAPCSRPDLQAMCWHQPSGQW